MANADFSREQNQTPGGFDSGSYREAKRPDTEAMRLTPLQQKLAGLEAGHEMMVSANAYYRKNKTLDGFEGIPADTMAWITKPKVYPAGGRNGDGSPLQFHGKPFPTYALSNSNANIKRVKERITKLEAAKAAASKGGKYILEAAEAGAVEAAALCLCGIKGGVAELVILRLLLRVGKDLVGFVYFLEFFLCLSIAWVQIRVVLLGSLSKGAFYFGL